MKRIDLVAHLRKNDCILLREGGGHSIYFNPSNLKTSAVPRHREIKEFTARKICKDLDIPLP